MAKSKSGGTRSYIRGRVGADVYSIGRDAKGAKQQVVRSLAETVANPQTVAQMRGRMIMSTVMQAVSAMRQIIDHSFDNVPTGQPSISEFISRNYALIKADVAAHPASGNQFLLNAFKEKGAFPGVYVVSEGNAVLPSAVTPETYGGKISLTPTANTVGDLKAALGLTADEYLTIIELIGKGGAGGVVEYSFGYARYHINSALADSTVISSENINNVFNVETNLEDYISLSTDGGKFDIFLGDPNADLSSAAVIISKKSGAGYIHNSATMQIFAAAETASAHASDVVLPSYPVGTEMFLNGGEL
jgi:hypothetical protein